MKKLLILMGALGLTATGALPAMLHSANASVNLSTNYYDELEGLLNKEGNDNIGLTEKLIEKINRDFTDNLQFNLSEINVPLSKIKTGLPTMAISDILKLALFVFQNIEISKVPSRIPTSLKAHDPDQIKWNNFVNSLANISLPTILDGEKLGQELDKEYTYDVTLIGNGKLKFTIRGIINGLAPDIIHFANFIRSKGELKDQNMALMLLQYLISPIVSYENDGFADINKKEEGIKSNIDSIVHDLFAGWVTANGEQFGSGKYNHHHSIGPISISVKLLFTTINVVWNHLYENNFGKMLKGWYTDLFNYNLLYPLPIHIKAKNFMRFLERDVYKGSINIKNKLETLLPHLLPQLKYSSEEIDNHDFAITKGRLVIHGTSDKENWEEITSIEKFLEAEDFYLKFEDFQLKVTSKSDLTVSYLTDENLSFRLNSDISSEILKVLM